MPPRSTVNQYEINSAKIKRTPTKPKPNPHPTSSSGISYNRSPMPDIENIRAYGSVRNAQAGQAAANAARRMLPSQYNDPFAGQTPWDLGQDLLTQPTNTPPGGGGSHGGGGGGGGGGSAVNPAALQAAYAAMLARQFDPSAYDPTAQLAAYGDQPINDLYDRQLRDANTGFDAASAGVTANAAGGVQRLGEIYNQLGARAGVARGQVGQSFDQSRAALDQVRQQALATQGQNQAGINDTLARFGAGSVQGPTGDLEALLSGLQGVQTNARGAYDQNMVDRNEAYAGLNSDVSQGIAKDAAGMQQGITGQRTNAMTSIAGQRAAALQAQAQQRAQIQATMAQAQAQAQAAWQQQQDEIRLQAAQLGITI